MNMAVLVVFNVKNLSEFETRTKGGEEVYKYFLSFLSLYDRKKASLLYDESDINPFSCSPIITSRKPQGGKIIFKEGEKFKFEIGLLTEEIKNWFEESLKVVLQKEDASVSFDGKIFKFIGLKIKKSFDLEDVKRIIKSRDFTKICITFKSPCVLKNREIISPFPEPEKVLKSILRRWDKFLPYEIGLLEEVFSKVMVERYKLKTEILAFKKFKLIGFVGEVCYNLRKIAKEDRVKIALLFEYGTYSGVGYKVSMGMGKIDIKGYY